ncbi:cadherin-5 [Aplochiton taeniatus]
MGVCVLWWFLLLLLDPGLSDITSQTRASGSQNQDQDQDQDQDQNQNQPSLVRHKREWVWNSLYVEEERELSGPFKIGKLKSTRKVEVKHFKIQGEGVDSIFTVDQHGDLFVNRKLDREEKATYHLTAQMFDGNNNLVEQAGEFVVQVTDLNDNTPVFAQNYNASVRERSTIDTVVTEVKATDADDPTTANGELRYTIRPGGNQSPFTIDSEKGVLKVSGSVSLDREVQSRYVVVVEAKDMRGIAQGNTATTSVTITVTDGNDNMASFTQRSYEFRVPEDQSVGGRLGVLQLEDRDEIQNKQPVFTVPPLFNGRFKLEPNPSKDGALLLAQPLDFETQSSFSFDVQVKESGLLSPADNKDSAVTQARVSVVVLDVDEPPVFSKPLYSFSVLEEMMVDNVGGVTAKDPDREGKDISYSVVEKDCPVSINPLTGQLSTRRKLDRELLAAYQCQVKAQEEPNGLASFVKVNVRVLDINDNEPELEVDDVYVCEGDQTGVEVGIVRASDRDEQPATFTFHLAKPHANFSLIDNKNGSARIVLNQGGFSLDDPRDYTLEVGINDGGRPAKNSLTSLSIKVCVCDREQRIPTQCKTMAHLRMGVSVHALIAILLCILTILVIVILMVIRRRYHKEALVSMGKSSGGEIHEQLVTYDEEGGGEMDTNGYDVSILTSARHQGAGLYARVHKAPPPPPTACKGDMALMIEVKKEEADGDREGIPYDTLHIYGYEGGEGSLAGSLSSMDSSSSGSNLDYDFLSDWGPRFRSLAELYGVEGPPRGYSPY